jgi:hypothetical protein
MGRSSILVRGRPRNATQRASQARRFDTSLKDAMMTRSGTRDYGRPHRGMLAIDCG